MKNNNPKSVTLLALITLILSAGSFKDELSVLRMWDGSWNFLQIFIAIALFYAVLLLCYLIVEMGPEVTGFKFTAKYSKNIVSILNTVFLLSLILLLVSLIGTLLLIVLAYSSWLLTCAIYLCALPFILKSLKALYGEMRVLIGLIREQYKKDA